MFDIYHFDRIHFYFTTIVIYVELEEKLASNITKTNTEQSWSISDDSDCVGCYVPKSHKFESHDAYN